jgi:glutamyl-Q tRNA(Asp) synthetase
MMITTRFAPSPTGALHLGHAYAALFARDQGTKFLLRIEDIDTARCNAGYEAAILDDLAWLGLTWEQPVLRQSTRLAAYGAALAQLQAMALVYPCFCSRAEIAAEIARAGDALVGPDGFLYPGVCRQLGGSERAARIASGEAYALRLNSAKAAARTGPLSFHEQGEGPAGRINVDPLCLGDVVLARKDTPSAYHLAVVVDDAFQGVTLVTRGQDLFAATHIQRLLQAVLGLPEPAYAHHKLILDAAGKKFSKRDHAVTLRSLREAGLCPDDIRARIGYPAAAMISRK